MSAQDMSVFVRLGSAKYNDGNIDNETLSIGTMSPVGNNRISRNDDESVWPITHIRKVFSLCLFLFSFAIAIPTVGVPHVIAAHLSVHPDRPGSHSFQKTWHRPWHSAPCSVCSPPTRTARKPMNLLSAGGLWPTARRPRSRSSRAIGAITGDRCLFSAWLTSSSAVGGSFSSWRTHRPAKNQQSADRQNPSRSSINQPRASIQRFFFVSSFGFLFALIRSKIPLAR